MQPLTEPQRGSLRAVVAAVFPPGPLAEDVSISGLVDGVIAQLETPWGCGKTWYFEPPFEPDAHPAFGWQSPLPPLDAVAAWLNAFDEWSLNEHGRRVADLDADTVAAALDSLNAGHIPGPSEVPARLVIDVIVNQVHDRLSCFGWPGLNE